jgi:ureidoacrylate peracid hydrolase
VPQPTTVSEYVRERLQKIRGDLRLFKDLRVEDTALVVIDMQNAFVAPGGPIPVPASREIVPTINRMVQGCRALGVPVIWIRSHHPKLGADWRNFFDHFVLPERRDAAAAHLSDDAPGSHFYSEMDVRDEDYVVIKNRYSCFIPGSSSLERLLRSQKKDTILLAGTKTNICIESTARDGMMLDFRVVVLSDACASLSDQEQQASLDVMIQEFADILLVDDVLEELRANAHPEQLVTTSA